MKKKQILTTGGNAIAPGIVETDIINLIPKDRQESILKAYNQADLLNLEKLHVRFFCWQRIAHCI